MIPATLEALKVPVDELRPYGRNPRRGNLEAIKASLEAHGQYRPVVVRRGTGEVLAGNHTLKAAQDLGWLEVAATYVDVDDDEAARIVLVDNRTNDLAGYDDTELAGLLESLPDLGGTGYLERDLERLLASLTVLGGEDTESGARPEHPVSEPGTLWQLGGHRLLCGDSTDRAVVEHLMAGTAAQLVFTDPPYGVDYDGGTKPQQRLAGDQHGTNIYAAALPQAAAASDREAPLYLWHAGAVTMPVLQALDQAGYVVRAQIIWRKNQAQYGALSAQYKQQHEPCFYAHRKGISPRWYGPTNETTIWDADRAAVNDLHPTQKPIELAERAIRNSSPQQGAVLDLFAGSGSTLIAAENLGRHCYALELDPGYCDVIIDRWERHTGQKATRVG